MYKQKHVRTNKKESKVEQRDSRKKNRRRRRRRGKHTPTHTPGSCRKKKTREPKHDILGGGTAVDAVCTKVWSCPVFVGWWWRRWWWMVVRKGLSGVVKEECGAFFCFFPRLNHNFGSFVWNCGPMDHMRVNFCSRMEKTPEESNPLAFHDSILYAHLRSYHILSRIGQIMI